MRRLLMGVLLALAAAPALAQAKKEPIVLRDMGSFHVGGRLSRSEVSGSARARAPGAPLTRSPRTRRR